MFVCKERFFSLFLSAALLSAALNGCSAFNKVHDIRPSELPSKVESSGELSKKHGDVPTVDKVIRSVVTGNSKPTDAKPASRGSEKKVPGIRGSETKNSGRDKTDKTATKLKGLVICIDAGHQKKVNLKKEPIAPGSSELKVKDPGGASGIVTKIPEHELNLKVSRLLKSRLEGLGATVVMTRESSDVNLGNTERAEMANRSNANLFIRIHADGSDNSAVKGISVLIPGSKHIKDVNVVEQSKNAGKSILKGLVDITSAKSRGIIERNDLTGFNWSKVPVVLVEMGFLSNPEEDRLLNTAQYQNKIVEGITNGLVSKYSKN